MIKKNTNNSLIKELNIIPGNIYGLPSIKLEELILKKSRKINIIDLNNRKFNTESVKSEINYYCELYSKKDKSFKKVIEKQFSLFNIDLSILDKKIYELSNSERNMFYILLNTLFDHETFIFNNLFDWLDRNNQKVIKNYLTILKENKRVIVIDNDINSLYDLCDIFVYLMRNKEIVLIPKNDMPNYLKKLISEKQSIPDVLYLTYLAKTNKKIKLTYYSDVRDVMKDIYKHV